MTEQPVGPRCGNNPNARLTDGDRKAVADFKARLALQADAQPYIAAADWVDGDPLMEVIAATIWKHCARDSEDMPQVVCDDPRTIAAYAAAVARAHAAATPPPDQTALERIRAIHQPVAGEGDTKWCQVCSQEERQPQPVGWWVPWPCPTLQAVNEAPSAAPPTTDQAAVLLEAAEHLLARCPHLGKPGALRKCTCPAAEELIRLASQEPGAADYASAREDVLRRLAAEAQQPGVARCPSCGHTICDGDGACGALLDAWQRCTCTGPGAQAQQPDTETPSSWTPGPVALARGADWATKRQDATVDPAMCPRCKGDNSEAFELCAKCTASAQQDGARPC